MPDCLIRRYHVILNFVRSACVTSQFNQVNYLINNFINIPYVAMGILRLISLTIVTYMYYIHSRPRALAARVYYVKLLPTWNKDYLSIYIWSPPLPCTTHTMILCIRNWCTIDSKYRYIFNWFNISSCIYLLGWPRTPTIVEHTVIPLSNTSAHQKLHNISVLWWLFQSVRVKLMQAQWTLSEG